MAWFDHQTVRKPDEPTECGLREDDNQTNKQTRHGTPSA